MIKKITKNAICNIAGLRPVLRFHEKRRTGKVIILMYHRINETFDSLGLSVSSYFFEQQLKYVTDYYKLITFEEVINVLKSEKILENYVVITFDDGYMDNLTNAYPLLKKYNAPATIFIACDAVENGNTDWNMMDHALVSVSGNDLDLTEFGLGRIPVATSVEKNSARFLLRDQLKKVDHSLRRQVIQYILASTGGGCSREMLTWEEVRKLGESGLVAIGAHTVSHPILSKLSAEDARIEIFESKRIIADKTGLDVNLFAYPNGRTCDFNETTVALVKEAGFRAACTTVPGINISGEDPLRLKRIDVTNGICMGLAGRFSPSMFGSYISGEYSILTGRA